ncbi:MAG: M14 family zinc carboxypeptidase [Promethearchaeota archaeon]
MKLFLILFLFLITPLPFLNSISVLAKSSKINTFEIEFESITTNSASDTEPLTYYYHLTYNSLLTDLIDLNDTYPKIVEVFSLNKRYNIPNTTEGFEIWTIRITNESTGFEKPEVLFIGTHHGNEGVATECAFWLAWWLCKNYNHSSWIQYLIDHREIYIIPLLNPSGHEIKTRTNGNGVDLNRNYDYDWSESENGGIAPFSERETQCIRELTEDHQFVTAITWHSGTHGIYYAWGAYAHNSNNDDFSPDTNVFFNHAKLMSREGGIYGEGYYEYGVCNDFLYPAHGTWEDWSYAALEEYGGDYTLDTDGYEGAGTLSFLVEVSSVYWPDEETLGGEAVDGWIPKNIRLSLVLIDLAEPYLEWDIQDSLSYVSFPNGTMIYAVAPNNSNYLKWQVNGSILVDKTNLRWGSDPDPINNYQFEQDIQNGMSSWDGDLYTQQLTTPVAEGYYYFVARAQVDSIANDSGTYSFPYSRYAKQRNWVQWSESAVAQTMKGQLDWYSPVLPILVTNDLPLCEIISPSFEETVNGLVSIKIKVLGVDIADLKNVSVVIDGNSHFLAEFAHEEEIWIFLWNTTLVGNGSHSLRARITTLDGISSMSSKLLVNVNSIEDTSTIWIEYEFLSNYLIALPILAIGIIGTLFITKKSLKRGIKKGNGPL